MLDEPHRPACRHGSADEERKAERAEAHHLLRLRPLRDGEDDGGEEREEQYRAEVREGHDGFLPLASECASTAATMFNSPATTMNLVP